MANQVNGMVNGHGPSPEPSSLTLRFSDVPSTIEIPVSGGAVDEAVELEVDDLQDDPTELCTLLENENVGRPYWITIALAYAKKDNIDTAIEIINRGIAAHSRGRTDDRLALYDCLCWFYLVKSRAAPRVLGDAKPKDGTKIKDHYLRAATTALNEASRISPSYPPLFLGRGVLCLLRAALLQDQMEKNETLRQAARAFDDAIRVSKGKNMMALLGRARTNYSLGKYGDALQAYQQVLARAPDLVDPDPRIGIGCCFWQLNRKEDAKAAWQRALDLEPTSKVANVLLGLFYLDRSSHLAPDDPKFAALYKMAIVQYTQQAFKIDSNLPLACATFGSYFLVRKTADKVEPLARKAIELTDVNAIASDGWFLLARREHYAGSTSTAVDFYAKSDQARGGDDKGYLPAKFGMAQLRVLDQDFDNAKFRLEKIVQQTKSVEALTLLGMLLAEDVFSGTELTRDQQAFSRKKSITLLETVRQTWKDANKHYPPDAAVLLTLARLYEAENPEKSLQCLQKVEQMELDELPNDLEADEDEDVRYTKLRQHLPPQLLNNIACFHFAADRLNQARDTFQSALEACVQLVEKDKTVDTDPLVTTITYNLARTYEAENLLDDAKKVYEDILERHPDYVDAQVRLTYINLRQSPTEEGPKMMVKLYENHSNNMEVRALYGWYLRKAKRRTANLAEDQEQRHFKHTLQGHDKHDHYSLTAMGNVYLANAREMRRETEQEKEKRRKMYERAVEFFDKALQLDPRNGYAAQGIAIAMIEDKKDFAGALQVFSKVKETVKDASVNINMGHVYCELKQYSRAIESYEAALAKERARDPQVLACLGRAWLLRGKQEKNITAMKTSLDYSQRALQVAPDQIHFRFNIAFVQIQIAQLILQLPDSQRTLEEVESAASGLDTAIESFSAIARMPNPPFPKHDIEQRANMGRNTMRKQLDRTLQSQRDYEERNADRLQKAREQREADIARRAAEQKAAEEAAAEQRRKVAEERQKMIERDREIAEQRARDEEEERKKKEDEMTADEGGNQVKRKKKMGKRKKKTDDFVTDDDDVADRDRDETASGSEAEKQKPKRKKRKLERRSESKRKFLSDERIVDSDEELDDMPTETNGDAQDSDAEAGATEGDDNDAVRAVAPTTASKRSRVVDDDDDEEEEDDDNDAENEERINGDTAATSGDADMDSDD